MNKIISVAGLAAICAATEDVSIRKKLSDLAYNQNVARSADANVDSSLFELLNAVLNELDSVNDGLDEVKDELDTVNKRIDEESEQTDKEITDIRKHLKYMQSGIESIENSRVYVHQHYIN